MAGDVYAEPPHVGRGGWSWYTGSAGWMYRGILEGLLGFKLHGNRLELNPCIPQSWSGFRLQFRHQGTHYEIQVENPQHICQGVCNISLDGRQLTTSYIELVNDQKTHHVQITLESTSLVPTSKASMARYRAYIGIGRIVDSGTRKTRALHKLKSKRPAVPSSPPNLCGLDVIHKALTIVLLNIRYVLYNQVALDKLEL